MKTTNETIRADGCIIADDRSAEEKKTHVLAIVAADRFMSGWGRARGTGGSFGGERGNGVSRCAWAFDPTKVNDDRVFNWVKNRKEMRYVNLVNLRDYRAPRGTAHFHIYVCNPDHPAATF